MSARAAATASVGALALAVACAAPPARTATESSSAPTRPARTAPEAAAPAPDVAPERRAFWRAVALDRGSVPAGDTAAGWARELAPWLSSTDPELRDDLAYTILSGWIRRGKIEDEPLRELAALWRAQLAHAGSADEDVVARSFAALSLASVVAWENRHPFLGTEVARIRDAARAYASRETDVRGYDATLGWVHATAHAADLLEALAREPALPREQQAEFLAAIDAKAALPGATWTAGEDLRLARVARSLVARPDFDDRAFDRWVEGYESAHRDLWAAPRVDPARLAEVGNRRRVLAELAALLAGEHEELRVAARERVLKALASTG